MMKAQLLLLLGETTVIDDDTVQAAISLASQHYLRFRPYTGTNWGANPRAYSWIMEYALAYCKLLLGDFRVRTGADGGQELVTVGSAAIEALDTELNTFA